MSLSSASADEVVTVLMGAGYRKISPPLTVASIPFDFTAALVGTERSSDLVVVLDTIESDDFEVRRKVEGLSRALDVAGSKRPLTAILVGPSPRTKTLDQLGRVCRVLLVSRHGEAGVNWINDALAVLLPLRLPSVEDPPADPMTDLDIRMSNADIEKPVLDALISATMRGAESVEATFRELLEAPLMVEDAKRDTP